MGLYDEPTRAVTPFVLEATGATAAPPRLDGAAQLTHWVLDQRTPLVIPDVAGERRFAGEMAYLQSRGRPRRLLPPAHHPAPAGRHAPRGQPAAPRLRRRRHRLPVAGGQPGRARHRRCPDVRRAGGGTGRGARAPAHARASEQLLRAISPALDVRDVFQQVAAIARSLVPHDMVSLPLIDEDGRHVIVHAVAGSDVTFPARVPLPDHMQALVHEPWDFIVHPDLQADPRERVMPPGQAGYRARLVVPIRIQGRLAGALDFFSFEPDRYSEADVPTAQRIADHVALALAHQRLAEEARRVSEATAHAAVLERRVTSLTAEVHALGGHQRVVGPSASWRAVMKQAAQVAATDTTVLLLGESGTGKRWSRAASIGRPHGTRGPFVAINCAALPDSCSNRTLRPRARGVHGRDERPPRPARTGRQRRAVPGRSQRNEPGRAGKFLRVLQERE
ncbi:MAG: GAF domain-containing protein [Vicinamibacterales bacterium]